LTLNSASPISNSYPHKSSLLLGAGRGASLETMMPIAEESAAAHRHCGSNGALTPLSDPLLVSSLILTFSALFVALIVRVCRDCFKLLRR